MDHIAPIALHDLVETRRRYRDIGPAGVVSLVAGTYLVAYGLGRRDIVGVAAGAVGAWLAYRGLTGQCSVSVAGGLDLALRDVDLEAPALI